MVDADGHEQAESVRLITVKPRDVWLVDVSPPPSGQVHVQTVDRGRVTGALIVRDES